MQLAPRLILKFRQYMAHPTPSIGRSGPQHAAMRANSTPFLPLSLNPRKLISSETRGSLCKGRPLRCVPRHLRPPPAMYASGSDPKTCVAGFHRNLPVR
ncbi:hypothetical protein LY76DRAFT_598234 [Colletotrichum caudatum]|nr:hypothetical protein LY76DRAFT_598234 [Colletotrichum caudatum]